MLDAAGQELWQALERNDWDGALRHWSQIGTAGAADRRSCLGASIALRKLRRFAEAEAVIDAALQCHPDAAQLIIDRAWIAVERTDWAEARVRWRAVRAQLPDEPAGYIGLGISLRALRDFDGADAVLQEGRSCFPEKLSVALEWADVAVARQDRAEAARRWERVQALFPDAPQIPPRRIKALREAARLDEAETAFAEAVARWPDAPALRVEHALVAQARSDWPEALRRWGEVKARHPALPDGYVGACQMLRRLGRAAEAEAVLAPALRLFPDQSGVLAEHGWNANHLGLPEEAARRWAAVRARFPDHPVGYAGAAAASRAAGRFAEADALLSEAVARFPADLSLALDHAHVARRHAGLPEAIARLRRLGERFAHAPAVHAALAAALRDAGQFEAAEAAAQTAHARFPGDWQLRMGLAQIAARRGDHPEALRRWSAARAEFPDRVEVHAGAAAALREAGAFAEAETVLAQALQRFPGHLELERQRALTFSARRDWPAALTLWDALRRRAPDSQVIRDDIRGILWRARIDQGADGDAGPTFEIPEGLLSDDRAEEQSRQLRDLMLAFESLGDTCEFGILQRRFGAEPLGLLRWASIRPERLLAALQFRFAGIGEPEQTVLRVANGEYMTGDMRYAISSHSFTPEVQVPRERFYEQHCKRAKFLRRVLIEVIEAGEKVLVYKFQGRLRREQLLALHDALREYNAQATLLGVGLEEPGHPSGSVTRLRDGLLAGFVDRFSNVDVSVDAWLAVCRAAVGWHAAVA